jgi:putative acyl-CoA dehydrogenase
VPWQVIWTASAVREIRKPRGWGSIFSAAGLRAVLVDLALESEAALLLAMRLAQAYESDESPVDRAWKRVMTPAAKFWVCKRGVELTGEAMEVQGGNGYVETGVLARLFREAPVNSIWEGSGNVMRLDVLRAIAREPDAAEALLAEFGDAAAGEPRIAVELDALQALVATPPDQLEALGRVLVQRLVLVAQACLLRRHAPAATADAFIATRLAPGAGRVAGAIDTRGIDVDRVLARAFPA